MTQRDLIESIVFLVSLMIIKIAFLAAGCWMIYSGWFGCGITTIIFGFLTGGHYGNETTKKRNGDGNDEQ